MSLSGDSRTRHAILGYRPATMRTASPDDHRQGAAMPQLNRSRRRPATASTTAAVLLVVLASFALAACGGSSSSSSTSASASASASTSTTHGTPGALGSRFKGFRECLQKNGVTLPKFSPGQRPAPGTGAGPGLPSGASKGQYEAAIKKCNGAGLVARGRVGLQSAAVKQALAKFATCMRANGVNVPKPNTSGRGALFNSKGLNRNSAKFKAAEAKCRVDLRGAFRGVPGLRRGTPGGGPPTAG